ncbi:hypothetical protein TNCV_3824601 [Trichonephila clavipes]|nr:hypothetical protein TNCV_3824601 [Trichonephila clavipes]
MTRNLLAGLTARCMEFPTFCKISDMSRILPAATDIRATRSSTERRASRTPSTPILHVTRIRLLAPSAHTYKCHEIWNTANVKQMVKSI